MPNLFRHLFRAGLFQHLINRCVTNPKIEDPDPEPILNQVQHKVQDDILGSERVRVTLSKEKDDD